MGDFADSMNSSSLKGKQYDMCMTKRTNMDPHTNMTAIDRAHWTSWNKVLASVSSLAIILAISPMRVSMPVATTTP